VSGCRKASRACSTRAGEYSQSEMRTDRMTDMIHSMISYPNYKFIFPIKALGMFAKKFGNVELQ